MNTYIAPYYSKEDLELLDEEELHFPFSDDDATYIGRDHQYELTSQYFQERGRNLEIEIEGDQPDKVKLFLAQLRRKFYSRIYNTNKSTRPQLNYMIAKRGLRGYTRYEYRQAFLEAMFIEGEYLLDNGDISGIAGVDFDTMQNMSEDVMRNQERDFHKDAVEMLKTLGLRYFGKYTFIPQGKDW
jgi:hypothetical protein